MTTCPKCGLELATKDEICPCCQSRKIHKHKWYRNTSKYNYT